MAENDVQIKITAVDNASPILITISNNLTELGNKTENVIPTVGKKIQAFGQSLQTIGTGMQSMGMGMAIGITLPIEELGRKIVTTSMSFEAGMELIRTQAGATQDEVTNLSKAVLDFASSGETGQSPQKLADGLYHLESLGLRGKDAMDALTISAKMSDLGLADMEGTTNSLGAALVTGIKGTENMTQAAGLLDATIGQGNMKMNDLNAALGTGILPAAKNFGLGLQDVGAALATLTDNGMRADESATRLRMTFAEMGAPTHHAQKAMAELGLSSMQLAKDMREGGITQAVWDLRDHLDTTGFSAEKNAALLSQAFGGGRSSAAIMTLVQQVDRLQNKFDMIGESAGTFDEKFSATQQTNLYKYNAAMASINATMIDMGGTVMPILADQLKTFTALLHTFKDRWDQLSPSVKNFIVISLEFLAALAPVLIIVGSLITAFGSIVTAGGVVVSVISWIIEAIVAISAPLVIALAVIAFFAYELISHWTEVKNTSLELWTAITGDISSQITAWEMRALLFWTRFKAGFSTLYAWFKEATSTLWKDIKDLFIGALDLLVAIATGSWDTIKKKTISFIDDYVKFFRDSFSVVSDAFSFMISGIVGVAKVVFNGVLLTIQGFVNSVIGSINMMIEAANAVSPFASIPLIHQVKLQMFADGGIVGMDKMSAAMGHFASGGIIGGVGSGDTQPAMLTPGEMVLNSSQQANLFRLANGAGNGTGIVVHVSGNNFYGDDQSFADKIGDSIIKQFRQHSTYASFSFK